MSKFSKEINPTPFGLYDLDKTFAREANNIVEFVTRKLGAGAGTVELTKKQIWACFEEAASQYFSSLDTSDKYYQLTHAARHWIHLYTLALCTEVLGFVRLKFEKLPIPGGTFELNSNHLISLAREDKQFLLEQLSKLEEDYFKKEEEDVESSDYSGDHNCDCQYEDE